MMKALFSLVTLLLALNASADGEIKFAHKKIKLGAQTLNIEVATTQEQLERGLMFRQSLGEKEGMLFVYKRPTQLSFWMKNTFIPLSIGFFNEKKELIDIQEMDAVNSEMQQDIPSYRSRGLAQFALEVNKGWFQRNNVGLHTKFTELK